MLPKTLEGGFVQLLLKLRMCHRDMSLALSYNEPP